MNDIADTVSLTIIDLRNNIADLNGAVSMTESTFPIVDRRHVRAYLRTAIRLMTEAAEYLEEVEETRL